jgi:glyoxylase-like metal-dependent hydrolase (beta-lactamase superfamily II)
MEKIEISKDIYLCRFEKAQGKYIGLNILLIENQNEALLIDTGYESNFFTLKEHLDARNITITNVVVSHFHPDHTGGLKHINKANIYGSEFAERTLKQFNKSIDQLLPNIIVKEELVFQFGDHNIKLEENKGHSVDGLLVTIDDLYMYVADDMVYSHNGNSLVPLCSEKIIENHISSIKKIYNNYENKIMIPTHGMVIDNQSLIKRDLEDRLTYLKYIQQNPSCSLEDFIKNTGIKFIGEKNHIYNTNKEVKKL